MKFPDFKTLADHVEYLLNNAIVKLSTSGDKCPPRTPGCCFWPMQATQRFSMALLLPNGKTKPILPCGWSLWLG